VAAGDPDAVQKLLDSGLDVNSQVEAGLTAYHVARLLGDADMMAYLAQHGADTKLPIPPPDKLVDALFNRTITNQGPGAAVLVARDGKILFEKGYGLADIAHGVAFVPETQSRIGSITKQFTAAAILKLQEQGKLSVNDKLTKYFPDFPRGDEVTLRHLLTHTSGIHSFTDKPGFLDGVAMAVKPDDLINSIKNDPYDFDPGKKWQYDNSGYFLLGQIIEKVSGQSYGDYLQTNFFDPLGMKNTGVYRTGIRLTHEALGYQFESGGKFTNALNWDMSWAGGAGALYSTVEDLFRWNEAVFGGKVLPAASLKAAWTPVKISDDTGDDPDQGYGYGWFISKLRGQREISHGGGLNGFICFLMRLPRENFTVVVLANCEPPAPNVDPSNLGHLVAQFYNWDRLAPRSTQKANNNVSPTAFDSIVGRYDYGGVVMNITREGNHVYAQLGEQPRCEIFPKSATEFFWKVVEAQVKFVKDSNGKVTKAVHLQNGHTLDAPRLEEIVEIKVDPSSYDAFAGKYDYGDGQSIMTVTREGDHLFAQLTGQPKYEILPMSPTKFFWKIVDAQVEFVKGDSGKVQKAIHHQSGHTFEAPKLE
jgi:CubicO group peptidase (beta-lactamase class C family)